MHTDRKNLEAFDYEVPSHTRVKEMFDVDIERAKANNNIYLTCLLLAPFAQTKDILLNKGVYANIAWAKHVEYTLRTCSGHIEWISF